MLCKTHFLLFLCSIGSRSEVTSQTLQTLQTKPLVPFLDQNISDIFYVLMSRFLNRVILADAATRRRKNLIVYVLDEKNWCPSEDVDCGITASKLLKQSSERITDRKNHSN